MAASSSASSNKPIQVALSYSGEEPTVFLLTHSTRTKFGKSDDVLTYENVHDSLVAHHLPQYQGGEIKEIKLQRVGAAPMVVSRKDTLSQTALNEDVFPGPAPTVAIFKTLSFKPTVQFFPVYGATVGVNTRPRFAFLHGSRAVADTLLRTHQVRGASADDAFLPPLPST
jgi:hypothetical protein